MKYMILLAGHGTGPTWNQLSDDERAGYMERHHAFGRACAERNGVEIVAGEALDDGSTATTMRTSPSGDVTITDGPFAEATEHIGGFYVLDAPHLDVVLELCRILPPYDIELRPVLEVR